MSESTKRSTQRSKKTNNTSRNILIGGLALLAIILGGYSYRSTFYNNHYLPNTFIEGIDVSNLTTEEADKKVQERYASESFTITLDNQEWQTINKVDLGLQTVFTDELTSIKQNQNNWLWGFSYFHENQYSLGDAAFDEETLTKKTTELQSQLVALNEDREPTKNATLSKGDDGFSITPEQIGTELDTDKILTELKAEVLAGQNSMELDDFEKVPTVTSEDESLKKELADLNKIAQVTATYYINGQTFQIPTENIMDWLSYTDGKVSLDRDKVYAYVTELGDEYDTSVNSTTFQSTKRGEVTVPSGTYSWTIDTDSETDELIANLLAGEDFTRSPISVGSAPSDAPLVGETYVEIDLTNQHMWYYKDGSLVLDTDIVSGKPTTLTPKGVHYIWNKEKNAILKGTNDDGSKYEQPVDYWMPLDWSGVGIHDANWQSSFGGNVWESAGSNGCINTPPDVMKKLFEAVEVGTPVLVF